ncbi:hypothetical protein M8C21_018138 [Ambrosia artemisiifolia]|uniref:Uncharacterized protein n=1 Tax=Ambrosia artemisiifolia TaxID=4212 RepID=A0AAD5CNR6_AMBAR|nr:hypothetical protein M8C21_018138 [Ambrosia artemisiifolia]
MPPTPSTFFVLVFTKYPSFIVIKIPSKKKLQQPPSPPLKLLAPPIHFLLPVRPLFEIGLMANGGDDWRLGFGLRLTRRLWRDKETTSDDEVINGDEVRQPSLICLFSYSAFFPIDPNP